MNHSSLKQYIVVSPIVEHRGSYMEPPEYGSYVVEVEASTKREAINKAIKTREFREWVREKRGDGQPPQSELQALDKAELDKQGY